MEHYKNIDTGESIGFKDDEEMVKYYKGNPEKLVKLTPEEFEELKNPPLTPEQEQEKAIAQLELEVATLQSQNIAGIKLNIILIQKLLELEVIQASDFPPDDRQFYQTIKSKLDELEAVKNAQI